MKLKISVTLPALARVFSPRSTTSTRRQNSYRKIRNLRGIPLQKDLRTSKNPKTLEFDWTQIEFHLRIRWGFETLAPRHFSAVGTEGYIVKEKGSTDLDGRDLFWMQRDQRGRSEVFIFGKAK